MTVQKIMKIGNVGGEVQTENKWYSVCESVAIVVTSRDSRFVARGLVQVNLAILSGDSGCDWRVVMSQRKW